MDASLASRLEAVQVTDATPNATGLVSRSSSAPSDMAIFLEAMDAICPDAAQAVRKEEALRLAVREPQFRPWSALRRITNELVAANDVLDPSDSGSDPSELQPRAIPADACLLPEFRVKNDLGLHPVQAADPAADADVDARARRDGLKYGLSVIPTLLAQFPELVVAGSAALAAVARVEPAASVFFIVSPSPAHADEVFHGLVDALQQIPQAECGCAMSGPCRHELLETDDAEVMIWAVPDSDSDSDSGDSETAAATFSCQIMLRGFTSPEELLLGCDVPATRVLLHANPDLPGRPIEAWCTDSFLVGIAHSAVWMEPTRCSGPASTIQLWRCWIQGFDLWLPGLDRARLEAGVYVRAGAGSTTPRNLGIGAALLRVEAYLRSHLRNHGDDELLWKLLSDEIDDYDVDTWNDFELPELRVEPGASVHWRSPLEQLRGRLLMGPLGKCFGMEGWSTTGNGEHDSDIPADMTQPVSYYEGLRRPALDAKHALVSMLAPPVPRTPSVTAALDDGVDVSLDTDLPIFRDMRADLGLQPGAPVPAVPIRRQHAQYISLLLEFLERGDLDAGTWAGITDVGQLADAADFFKIDGEALSWLLELCYHRKATAVLFPDVAEVIAKESRVRHAIATQPDFTPWSSLQRLTPQTAIAYAAVDAGCPRLHPDLRRPLGRYLRLNVAKLAELEPGSAGEPEPLPLDADSEHVRVLQPSEFLCSLLRAYPGLVAAGGAALAAVVDGLCTNPLQLRSRQSQGSTFEARDVDLFLWGVSESRANDIVHEIINRFATARGVCSCGEDSDSDSGDEQPFCRSGFHGPKAACKTGHAITLHYQTLQFQLVLRLCATPDELLHGADLPATRVLLRANPDLPGRPIEAWCTDSFLVAIARGAVWMDPDRLNGNVARRAYKYWVKGFEVILPGLDRARIAGSVLAAPPGPERGDLCSLLWLEAVIRIEADSRLNEGSESVTLRDPSAAVWAGPSDWNVSAAAMCIDIMIIVMKMVISSSANENDYDFTMTPTIPAACPRVVLEECLLWHMRRGGYEIEPEVKSDSIVTEPAAALDEDAPAIIARPPIRWHPARGVVSFYPARLPFFEAVYGA